jgi:hypothetical protein
MLHPMFPGVAAAMRRDTSHTTLRRRRLLLAIPLLPALAACAELRTPRPRLTLPLELVPGTEDPVRSAARLAAAAFQNEGAGLAGHPAETARAAARLEYLTAILSTDPRFAALPQGLVLALRGAVGEVRSALGMPDAVLPEQAVEALAAIARAVDARGGGTGPLSDSLFPPGLFQAGPERTQNRLNEPGPLPEAAIATGRAQEAISTLDSGAGWGGQGWGGAGLGGGASGNGVLERGGTPSGLITGPLR